MGILIGMDEAGYGPNLGPLVVAATAWEVANEDEDAGCRMQGAGKALRHRSAEGGVSLASAARPNLGQVDLYHALRGTVSRKPSDRRIAIADSKALYKPGHGLRQLERGLHAVLAALGRRAACWSEVVQSCAADPLGHHRQLRWHDGFDCQLPLDAAPDELSPLGAQLANTCDQAGVRPLAIRARLVFPAEFNELTERYGTKGAALSHVTIGLLREVVDAVTDFGGCSHTPPVEAGSPMQRPTPGLQSSIFAVCDKHGGRNFYTGLLQHHFSQHWIEPVCEGAKESHYAWGAEEARVEVSFRVRGEAFLPTALASMTAKYLRELAMRAFNEFWCARVPGLRPTAGYPTDAPRFKRDIASLQRELGIDDHVLWRNR